jgi:L-lactate dehydrogenase complex protein LldG
MSTQARDRILGRLKGAERKASAERPPRPALSEMNLDLEGMLERFSTELTSQTGTVYKAETPAEAMRILGEIAGAENLKSLIAAGQALPGMDLEAFGSGRVITVRSASCFKGREDLREAAFTADAGLTFADFAVAETGTIGLIFRQGQPRLVSIAPPVHIAVIPLEKLYPVYENALEQAFGSPEGIPSQLALITGPSATGDIQAVQFKGMHGPVKVFAIFVAVQA